MKLKKFNEYSGSIKNLNLYDLSLWLRVDDTLLINDKYGNSIYSVNSIDEEGITATNEYGTRILLFSELNGIGDDAWEILKINNEDIFITEKSNRNR